MNTFKLSCAFVILLTLMKGALFLTCGFSIFDENLSKEENSCININYTINVTTSLDVTDTFNADYQVCEENSLRTTCIFAHDNNFNTDFKKDLSGMTGVTCYWEQRHVSSSVVALDIYISQVVTRSLSAMIFSTARGGNPKPTRVIRVEVLYPPNVKSLTVDGGDNVIIDEGQVVSVSCFFDKGNPSGVFYLLDKHGAKLNSSSSGGNSSEGHLSYSLTARCEDDWPVVRCEGNGSQHNRSVTILVKCRPQFVDNSTKIVSPDVDTVTFNIKAHTTAVNRCFLTSLTLQHNNTREVNCILTGNPPDLVLSLQLEREDSFRGNWTLTLSNDWGSSNTTFIVLDKLTPEISPELTSGKTINIILVCGIVAAVVLIAVAGTFAARKIKVQRYAAEGVRPKDGSRDPYENIIGNIAKKYAGGNRKIKELTTELLFRQMEGQQKDRYLREVLPEKVISLC